MLPLDGKIPGKEPRSRLRECLGDRRTSLAARARGVVDPRVKIAAERNRDASEGELSFPIDRTRHNHRVSRRTAAGNDEMFC